MRHFIPVLIYVLTIISFNVEAQVQVSKEPRHRKVLENKYLRILDVLIKPKDTTLFHIHSTPSVFLIFTNTMVSAQVKGHEWGKGLNTAGNASYRSFINDTLVHRVSNQDADPFHVIDVEILSPYKSNSQIKSLPGSVLFENEKVIAYRVTDSSSNEKVISGHGPMIAGVAEGQVMLHNAKMKKAISIEAGSYQFIEPESSFYFSLPKSGNINLVLFEIK